MARGFLYLVAVVDWATRRVLAWRLSNTLGRRFLPRGGARSDHPLRRSGNLNTDQGSQFTDGDFLGILREHGIAISMDGKAAGATTCLSSGCGRRSSTSRSICTPTLPCPRLGQDSPRTSISTIAVGRTPRLTDAHRMTCTSVRCRSNRRLNPQGYHLRNLKNCPTAWVHFYRAARFLDRHSSCGGSARERQE
jgi:putative transposase